jgi:hypothetical protein
MTFLQIDCQCLVFFLTMLLFSSESASVQEENIAESLDTLVQNKEVSQFFEDKLTFSGHSVKGFIDSEIARKWGTNGDRYEKNQLDASIVRLPICDLSHPPLEWHFVGKEICFRYLAHRDSLLDDSHFLKWPSGDWVRLFEKKVAHNDAGMICQNIWEEPPNQNNYIQVSLNQHIFDIVMQKQKMLAMLQHSVLQIHMRTTEQPVQMVGQIFLSSTPALDEGFLRLELWERNKEDWHLLRSVTGLIEDPHHDVQKWEIKAKAAAFSEIKMILRVDQKGLDLISENGFLSRLAIYDAVLRKSH